MGHKARYAMSTKRFLFHLETTGKELKDKSEAARWIKRYFQNCPRHPEMCGREQYENLGSAYCKAASMAPAYFMKAIVDRSLWGIDFLAIKSANTKEGWDLLERSLATEKGMNMQYLCWAFHEKQEKLIPYITKVLQTESIFDGLELVMKFPSLEHVEVLREIVDNPKCQPGTFQRAWDALEFIGSLHADPRCYYGKQRLDEYEHDIEKGALFGRAKSLVKIGDRVVPGQDIIGEVTDAAWTMASSGYGVVSDVEISDKRVKVVVARGFPTLCNAET